MTNAERIDANNAKLQECLTIAEGLPDAGGGECSGAHVIEVEVLPDAGAVDYNAVYLCGGRYYRYMAGGDTETWKFNDTFVSTGAVDFETLDESMTNVLEDVSNLLLVKLDDTYGFDAGEYYLTIFHVSGDVMIVKTNKLTNDSDDLYMCTNGVPEIGGEIHGKTFEVIHTGIFGEWLNANATLISGGGGWKEWIPKEECGGGAELNIAYGDTPPEDTTKMWCKCSEPSGVSIKEILSYEQLPITLGNDYYYAKSVIAKGKYIYVISPQFANKLSAEKAVYVYDTETDSFLPSPLNCTIPRMDANCAMYEDKVYIFGGREGYDAKKTIACWDILNGAWNLLDTSLSSYVTNAGCAVVDDKVYLFGGESVNYMSGINATIECFDMKTETVIAVGNMTGGARTRLVCVANGNDIFIFGGNDSTTTGNKNVYRFNTTDYAMSEVGRLPLGCIDLAYGCDGTKVYLFGGQVRPSSSDSYAYYNKQAMIYDMETNTAVEVTGVVQERFQNHGSVTIGDTIYVFGGNYGSRQHGVLKAHIATKADKDHLLIVTSAIGTPIKLLNSEQLSADTPIYQVLKGNGEGVAEPVEAYTYKSGAWTLI